VTTYIKVASAASDLVNAMFSIYSYPEFPSRCDACGYSPVLPASIYIDSVSRSQEGMVIALCPYHAWELLKFLNKHKDVIKELVSMQKTSPVSFNDFLDTNKKEGKNE